MADEWSSKQQESDEQIERDYIAAKLFTFELIAPVLKLAVIVLCGIIGLWVLAS